MFGQRKKRPTGRNAKPPSVTGATRIDVIGLALVLLAMFLVYLPALNGGKIWDDNQNITSPQLQSLGGLARIWFDPTATAQYYPLVHTAFWLEHKLWGDAVLGYHLVTLLWHALAVVLVYMILIELKVPGALLAAAIFAVHPVMVESVAWMCEQKNTLSAVFFLSSILLYLRFDESRKRSQYLMALGLFALGLMTKTAIVTLPVALLVIFWWQRGTLSWKRDVLPLLPFFVLAAAAGVLTVWVERKVIGAEGVEFELTFLQRALLAGRAICFYVGKLAWPNNLTFTYPRWTIDPAQWWQWIFPAAALATTAVLCAIHRRWRAPLAGWLYFCGTLFPVLGFLNVYMFRFTFVADHLQYLASLGMIVLAAAGIAQGLAPLTPLARRAGISLCVLLVCALGLLSFRQSRMYADTVTLYRATIDRNPDCWIAHNNLGSDLYTQGNHQEAIEHYRVALRIKPNYATAHFNLGAALANRGQLPEAIDHYHEALRLQPHYLDAHLNLGNALIYAGRLPEAIDQFQAALALRPDDPSTLSNLGIALMQVGRLPEAIEHIEDAVRLKPDYAEAHNNLGIALARSGRIPQAIRQFRLAVELNQNYDNAHNNWGHLLAETGDADEAITHFEQAAQLRPDRADVQNNLGEVLRQTGRPEDAIEHFRAALRLQPDFIQAYANLAQALALVDRSNEAIAMAQQGIEVARSTGQVADAEQIEEWLTHYRVKLQRSRDAASP